MKNEIALDRAFDFLLGGKCYTTIFNEITNNQRKFFIVAQNIRKYVSGSSWQEEIEYYKVFSVDETKKKYLGKINLGPEYALYTFDPYTVIDIEYKRKVSNFTWFWKHLCEKTLVHGIHILHLGVCGVCGRPLKDAESLALGIGPICLNRIHSRLNKS